MNVYESSGDIQQRQQMIHQQLRNRGIADPAVLRVMGRLPRQHFIPAENHTEAYYDQPVPIGMGQTISQPYIVALMTEKLQVRPHHFVLEVGTGCGYQTAILAQLARRVYTIERIESLARQARRNLEALGIANVVYHIGDGSRGWPAPIGQDEPNPPSRPPDAPQEISEPAAKSPPPRFDRILVAAASESIPPALLEQLADDGKLVIPVGPPSDQRLLLIEKKADKNRQPDYRETLLCYCRFVKLVFNSD